MGRERTELIRPEGYKNAEKLFVLSFEGRVSEKKYFADFRKSEYFNNSGLIEVIPLKRGKDKGSDPLSVKKLLKEAKDDYNFKDNDEFWLIIDRDDWENIHKISFDELVTECNKESNFFMAMSNPCFELWLLLHLKDISEYSEEEIKQIFENLKSSSTKNHIDVVLAREIGDGRGYNKRPNPHVFLPKVHLAIERAKMLDMENKDYPIGLGSHLYKLVEKLIS